MLSVVVTRVSVVMLAATSVYFAYYIPFRPVHIHDSKVFLFCARVSFICSGLD